MVKRLVFCALPVLALVMAGCSEGSQPPPPARGGSAQGGRPAGGPPPSARPSGGAAHFTLPMTNGQPVSVQGPVALFFFTTWCGYCKQVLPELNGMANQARARGVTVYGIDVSEPAHQVEGFIQSYQPNFPVLVDQSGAVAQRYGVGGYPTFVVIDGDGRVRYNAHELPRSLLR